LKKIKDINVACGGEAVVDEEDDKTDSNTVKKIIPLREILEIFGQLSALVSQNMDGYLEQFKEQVKFFSNLKILKKN
jgi:hypothetical protein